MALSNESTEKKWLSASFLFSYCKGYGQSAIPVILSFVPGKFALIGQPMNVAPDLDVARD